MRATVNCFNSQAQAVVLQQQAKTGREAWYASVLILIALDRRFIQFCGYPKREISSV
jgi:hypothetical protein